MLRLEYSLSQGGGLRVWFKLNLLLGLLIAAPALLVVPAATALVSGFASWSSLLLQIAHNLAIASMWIAVVVLVVLTLPFVVRQVCQRTHDREMEE